MAVYLVALGLFILYVLSDQLLEDPAYRTMAALTDPFALRAFSDVTRYWTPFEQNAQVVTLGVDIVWQNRAAWMALGLLVLGLFGGMNKPFAIHRPAKKKVQKEEKDQRVPLPLPLNKQTDIKPSGHHGWRYFVSRTRFR